MDMIEVEKEIARATQQLRAELAKEREKVKELESMATVKGAMGLLADQLKQLAAAQATIAEMRGYFWRDVSDELPKEAQEVLFVRDNKVVHGAWINGIFWHSNTKMVAAKWMPFPPVDISTLSIQCNQDALHEAMALECERLANSAGDVFAKHWLLSEASCHRARKEGK